MPIRLPPIITAAALLAVAATSAFALEPAELVDAKLDRQRVQLVNLAGGELSFFDDERRLRRVSAADFVSLRMVERAKHASVGPAQSQADVVDSGGGGVLALSDGHILHGSFGGAKDGRVLWVTQAFGVIPVELDSIVRMTLETDAAAPAATAAPAGGGDIVTLTNGDSIRGFIESIDEAGLKIKAENAQNALELPWDRLAKLTLANPVNRKAGVWVRLVDGTQFRLNEAAFDPQKLTGKAMGRDVNLPGAAVQSIDFALKHQLVPLGDLEPRLVSGGEVFGVAMPPHAAGDQMSLHAPVTVEFTLPAAAQRFATEAIICEADLEWADLTLIVTNGKAELARQRLNADQPRAAMNVALKGPTLVLQLDEGVNGPIRDRLHLDRAVILVQLK